MDTSERAIIFLDVGTVCMMSQSEPFSIKNSMWELEFICREICKSVTASIIYLKNTRGSKDILVFDCYFLRHFPQRKKLT